MQHFRIPAGFLAKPQRLVIDSCGCLLVFLANRCSFVPPSIKSNHNVRLVVSMLVILTEIRRSWNALVVVNEMTLKQTAL